MHQRWCHTSSLQPDAACAVTACRRAEVGASLPQGASIGDRAPMIELLGGGDAGGVTALVDPMSIWSAAVRVGGEKPAGRRR